MWCEDKFTYSDLSFHSLNSVFRRVKGLNFDEVSFVNIFSFMDYASGFYMLCKEWARVLFCLFCFCIWICNCSNIICWKVFILHWIAFIIHVSKINCPPKPRKTIKSKKIITDYNYGFVYFSLQLYPFCFEGVLLGV